MATLRDYAALTKPGIIRGNALTAVAGFCLAARGDIDWLLAAAMLAGICLIMASGCVFNNFIDRSIDAKMARTKRRALVAGVISGRAALLFGSALGLLGGFLLLRFTNGLTFAVAALGWLLYVVAYSYGKRHSSFGTVIGSLSGSIPPVVGYVAVTNQLDGGAGLLFIILALWQMPHFYAIAIYRLQDYAAAGLPVLPVERGVPAAKRQMLWYVVAFVGFSPLLTVFGYIGYVYAATMIVLGLIWLKRALAGAQPEVDNERWSRGMFKFSLTVIGAWCLALICGAWLP